LDTNKRKEKITLTLRIEIKEKKARLSADSKEEMPEKSVLLEIQRRLSYIDDQATQLLWQRSMRARIARIPVYKKLFNLKDKVFFSGLVAYVRQVLDEYSFEYEIKDLREIAELGTYDIPINLEGKELRPFQQDIIVKATESKKGIIAVATGLGKTFTSACLISNLKHFPVIFIVRRLDLLYQTKDNFEGFFQRPIGIIGNGKKQIEDITIISSQTAVNEIKENPDGEIAQHIKNSKVLFIDESHCARADTVKTLILQCNASYRYGLSATPFRESEDGGSSDDLLIEGLLGQKIVTIRAKDVYANGWDYLVKPSIHFVKVPKGDFDDTKKTYQYVFKHFIVQNMARTRLIAKAALELRKLGRTTLILTKQIDQIDNLLPLIPRAYVIKGDVHTIDRKEILDMMRRKEIDILIATDKIAEEGLDLPALDALIFTAPSKSRIKSIQAVGRAVRKYTDPETGIKKKNAIIINFCEPEVKFLDKHAKKRFSILGNEFGKECITLHNNLNFLEKYLEP
jgi:superfamily II DNA or RNA helicase